MPYCGECYAPTHRYLNIHDMQLREELREARVSKWLVRGVLVSCSWKDSS